MKPSESQSLVEVHQLHKFIEQTLKNFRRDKPPSKQWLTLYILSEGFKDEYEAFNHLEQLIKNIITSQLYKARQGQTQTAYAVEENYYGYRDRYVNNRNLFTVLQQEIGNSSSSGYQAIKIWSTLYHKYFVIHDLSDEQFAQKISVSSRQIRNYKTQGIELLTQQLMDLEKEIYHKTEQQYDFKSRTHVEQKPIVSLRLQIVHAL